MPIKSEREYRTMPVMAMPEERAEQLIASDFYVEGYATTFNQPYLLFNDGLNEFWEQIDRSAFDEADMTDVIFLHNHEGKCFARTKMRQGVAPTLILQPRELGLFTAADLSMTAEGRSEWEAITGGLVYQMSFAFTVREDDFAELSEGKILRTIKQIKKVYDVSSVDNPANPATFIDSVARSGFEGFIERQRQEVLAAARRNQQRKKIHMLTEVF